MGSPLNEIKTIDTDVLIIGGGGAGFRAAIGAREKGARALLVSKGALARSGASPMAGADLTCHGQGMRRAGFFGEPNDGEEKFMNDIVHHGNFLNDQKLTELYVKTGPDRMCEMVEWGVRPDMTDERAVFTKGTGIMDALLRQAKKTGVDFMEDAQVLDFVLQDGRISGALVLDIKQGELIRLRCKAAVVATGGWHKAYTPVTGSRELTGDGIAMAYRAGAALSDMEFVTFCCNVMYWPPYCSGTIMVYVMGFMYGGVLENSLGERIFDKYDPWMIGYANRTEWNKCFISHISAREIRDGKASPHGGVYFQVGDMPFAEFEARVSASYPNWTYKGVDMSVVGEKLKSGEGVEVGPGAEYFEGGIAVNASYETSVPGLYAAGECASSVFGANRVAAATMEMLTTGAIAGQSAGEYAESTPLASYPQEQFNALVEKAVRPLHRRDGARPSQVRRRIQETAQAKMGPIRTETEMQEFLAFLDGLKRDEVPVLFSPSQSMVYNKSWLEAMEIENMITVLDLSTRAALERKESRGVHYREDYPVVDNDIWLKEIVLQQVDGSTQISTRPVNVTSMTPPTGVVPYMDFIKRMMQGHSDTGGHH